MADRSAAAGRPPRVPLRPRSRRRWAVAAGIAGLWALLLIGTGSLLAGTALLMLAAAVALACTVAMRSLGINGDHPWVRLLASRPWRDGSDVLRLGLRHLAEVFIVTPSGSLLAPNAAELLMNPDDLAALTGVMDLEVINLSATELYQAQVTAHGARLASIGPVAASVVGDSAVPAGRYRLRQGRLVSPGHPDGCLAHPGWRGVPPGRPPRRSGQPSRLSGQPARLSERPGLRACARRAHAQGPGCCPDHRGGTADGRGGGGSPAAAGDSGHGCGDARLRGPRRAGRRGGTRASAGPYRVASARRVQLRRRPVADHQPGAQRRDAERQAAGRRARAR